MLNKTIKELHEDLISGKVTSDELVKESIKMSHEVENKYNAFVTILDDAKGGKVTDNLLSVFLLELKIIIQLREYYQLVHLIL